MRKIYEEFIALLEAGDQAKTESYFYRLSPIKVGTIVLMSQMRQGAKVSHSKLVGDFILKLHGPTVTSGYINIWE